MKQESGYVVRLVYGRELHVNASSHAVVDEKLVFYDSDGHRVEDVLISIVESIDEGKPHGAKPRRGKIKQPSGLARMRLLRAEKRKNAARLVACKLRERGSRRIPDPRKVVVDAMLSLGAFHVLIGVVVIVACLKGGGSLNFGATCFLCVLGAATTFYFLVAAWNSCPSKQDVKMALFQIEEEQNQRSAREAVMARAAALAKAAGYGPSRCAKCGCDLEGDDTAWMYAVRCSACGSRFCGPCSGAMRRVGSGMVAVGPGSMHCPVCALRGG